MAGPERREPDDLAIDEHDVEQRADLLPEERAVGSDDPREQAEAILAESADRTEHPDPDSSTQSGRRRSEDSL